MARLYKDRVGETSAAPGAGNFALGGALPGYQTFGGVAALGDTFDYVAFAVDANGGPNGGWETGTGTYAAGNAISRVVQASSNANAAVNFAGATVIFLSENAASIAALAAGGGGGGGTPIGSHRYWRVRPLGQYDYGNYSGFSGIEMRAAQGGPNIATGGTPIAAPGQQAGNVADIFPGNGTSAVLQYTSWQGMWAGYDFGAPVSIQQVAIYPDYGGTTRTPDHIAIQYSDDKVYWNTAVEGTFAFVNNVQTLINVPLNA